MSMSGTSNLHTYEMEIEALPKRQFLEYLFNKLYNHPFCNTSRIEHPEAGLPSSFSWNTDYPT